MGVATRLAALDHPPFTRRPSLLTNASAPSGEPPCMSLDDAPATLPSEPAEAAAGRPATTLAELAQLVRDHVHRERRRVESRRKLHDSFLANALAARLVHNAELTYRDLLERFRSDDKKSFAHLYDTLLDLRQSCLVPRERAEQLPLEGQPAAPPSTVSFMHRLSPDTRQELLNFLSRIRTDPDFLAARLTSLSYTEVAALAAAYPSPEPIESVMPVLSRGRASGSSSHRSVSHGHNAVERSLPLNRQDPLSILLHTVFTASNPASPEHRRRVEVWATTCARLLVDNHPCAEQLVRSVLNAWAMTSPWPITARLEVFLMKALQDGAFLLVSGQDESLARSKGITEPRTAKDAIAVEDFFDAAVRELFDILDDASIAGGMPVGVLDLARAMLAKLDDAQQWRAAQTLIVSKWFFSSFLLNALIYPESHGMLLDYHISEYARQRIFKEIASQASKHVLDLTLSWKQDTSILPHLRVHIENILAQIQPHRRTRLQPVLTPAPTTASAQGGKGVQDYVVMCPSDLAAIVSALFPERRPTTGALEREPQQRGLRSVTSLVSISSAASVPFPSMSPSLGGPDTGSVLSNSGSSITSVATSREPPLDTLGQSSTDGRSSFTSLGSRETLQNLQKPSSIEEYGQRLRKCIDELSQHTASSAVAGLCHPYADDWAILYLSADGSELKAHVDQAWDVDSDDDLDEDDFPNAFDPGAYFDGRPSAPEVDLGQLRRVVFALLEDFEVPSEAEPEQASDEAIVDGKLFWISGNDPSESDGWHDRRASDGLYLAGQRSGELPDRRASVPRRSLSLRSREAPLDGRGRTRRAKASLLERLLKSAVGHCQATSDHLRAQMYWRALEQLRALSTSSLSSNDFAPLIEAMSRGLDDAGQRSSQAIEDLDCWSAWVESKRENNERKVEASMRRIKELRDKMWYVTDVRNSAAYEKTRNVALALKSMGSRPRSVQGRAAATSRSRSLGKASTPAFLLKSEIQMIDLMTAPTEQGGPYKLSDEQSDMTSRWLIQFGVENFCAGEERIHRFCLEIDRCVSKLVGDDIVEGPVLWSSELYGRDRRQFEKAHPSRTGFAGRGMDEEVVNGGGVRVGPGGLDLQGRSGPRDLRSFSARLAAQSGVDVSRIGGLGGQGSSPSGGDVKPAFWPPFLGATNAAMSGSFLAARATAPGQDRTGRGGSVQEDQARREFLDDLKRTLLGFLLSDLGSLLWSKGSETDGWFSGELGQECLERQLERERRSRHRAIDKQHSTKTLRPMKAETGSAPLETLGRAERSEPAAPVAMLEHATSGASESRNKTAAMEAARRASSASAGKASRPVKFPYGISYRQILLKFSTHPNPFTKLEALWELEQLIAGSLSSGRGRFGDAPRTARSGTLRGTESPAIGHLARGVSNSRAQPVRAQNLEETIAQVEGRRSQLESRLGSGTYGFGQSVKRNSVVEVMRELCRDARMRPRALFRDLQFIASFVPKQILEGTGRGKAFWDFGVAALGLKLEVCRMMIETADDIVAYHTKNRSLSAGEPERAGPAMRFSMEDAAQMWSITAKEGDAVAQRELAIFYLTHPDLLARTTLPLSLPRDTFKAPVMSQRNEDPLRSDPATMCVAYHWMELSSLGGDDLARKYLRAREELNALP